MQAGRLFLVYKAVDKAEKPLPHCLILLICPILELVYKWLSMALVEPKAVCAVLIKDIYLAYK
jgi:hypothetical protein